MFELLCKNRHAHLHDLCIVILQQEIIEQLIENSTTFKGKTEYAQEKWVKKKKQKYVFSDT